MQPSLRYCTLSRFLDTCSILASMLLCGLERSPRINLQCMTLNTSFKATKSRFHMEIVDIVLQFEILYKASILRHILLKLVVMLGSNLLPNFNVYHYKPNHH
eukprot:GFKZ01014339.1.p1 GENE.GFKZ01014339.1~~GFKZ01014339.1.p1  ORF type:complete len:102 (+),score=2.45 GFKZ01014339.1:802-1107(+)